MKIGKKIKKIFGLTAELQHLNVKYILKNYKNPKFWKNNWLVFKTKDFEIFWSMSAIDVYNNSISSILTLHYHGKKNTNEHKIDRWCRSIPIDNPDYNQTVFTRNILGACLDLIDNLEEAIVKTSYEYKQALFLESKEENTLTEIAEEFLDSEKVNHPDIRNAYIDWYINDNIQYDYSSRVLRSSRYKYYPTARLLAYSWFGDEKGFEKETKTLEEYKGIRKKTIYEIWNGLRHIETDDYLEEMESRLEKIQDMKG